MVVMGSDQYLYYELGMQVWKKGSLDLQPFESAADPVDNRVMPANACQ